MRGPGAALADLVQRLARVSALLVASSLRLSGLSANESFVPTRELPGMKRTWEASIPDHCYSAFFCPIRWFSRISGIVRQARD